jgi:hypothetical protein
MHKRSHDRFCYIGSIVDSTSRKLRFVYWKEFEPIIANGEVIRAQCIHSHDYLSRKQSIRTSHLYKHLELCKLRSRVTELVDKIRAGSIPNDSDLLDMH